MGIGDAVRLRIIGLCEERKISINKLCSISGVTQSMSVPTDQRCTAAAAIRALDRSVGTDCQMAYKNN